MDNYKVIDMDTWPRSSHWNYYRNIVKAQISMTKKVDVTDLLHYCHEKKIRFSPLFLHAVAKTVNSMECMRLFAMEDGNPGIWDCVHANYTIFHDDDKTFSDVWIEYMEEENVFVQNYEKIIAIYKDKRGIKVRENQPANFFCISALPWVSYDSFTTCATGDRPPMPFPIMNYGKYEEENGRIKMPVTLTVSHAAMDGYHVAQFFLALQEKLDSYSTI